MVRVLDQMLWLHTGPRGLGPLAILVLVQCRGRQIDATATNDRLLAHWAAPSRFIRTIHRRSILRRLQTHRTGILSRCCIRSVEHNISVSNAQTLSADTTAVMTLEHRHFFGPLTLTEVAKDIRHLYVVWINAGLTHGGSINAMMMKRRNAESGQRSCLVWPREHAAEA